MRNLPGMPTHWLWGNLHQIDLMERLFNYILERKYKVMKFWIGPFYPVVWITHCNDVSKLLKEPKSSYYSSLKPWLGDSLLLSKGEKWKRNRHLLTQAFHYDILRENVPVFNSCLEILLKKWRTLASDGNTVLAFKDTGKLSLDIIMRCAFSSESNCQLSDTQHQYISSVSDLKELWCDRVVNFLHENDLIYYYFTRPGRKFKQACQVVHDYAETVIKERKKALKIGEADKGSEARVLKKKNHLDFIDILLKARDEDGRGLTDMEIRDEVDTFLFAGHDTTSSGISWTLYCLAKHPKHQDNVRKEVREVLRGREWLEYDDLNELKYTTWCIKEAMRLYPPATEFVRCIAEDKEVDGHMIPKGTTILLSIFLIHHHPDTWENPNEYDPLRFHPNNAEGRNPYAYMPFSAGHRNCIGQSFALTELKTVIATIINQFQVTVDERHEVEMVTDFILRAKNDIKLNLKVNSIKK